VSVRSSLLGHAPIIADGPITADGLILADGLITSRGLTAFGSLRIFIAGWIAGRFGVDRSACFAARAGVW